MSIVCSTEACPVILNSTCVFYQGDTLVYTGIYAGENLETALQKIDAKFQDAGLGYVFTDGLDQPSPGYPVGLGGELTKDIEIDGDYKLTFLGRLGASAFIKNGGVASQFLKADGSVDNTDYQPAGDYISSLTGDVLASGPGSSVASLATVNGNPGTYGSSVRVPIINVDNKGRVIDVTSTAINFPPTMISLMGDVSGFGNIGTDIVVTLDAVNANAYVGNNLLKFGVDNKGRVTSAAPISYNDLTGVLGFDPVPTTRTLTINGVAYNLNQNRSWNVGSVTSVTANAGPGISVAVTNPSTTPQITVTNTAPDQIVQLLSGAGIQVTGNYPNFTIKALNPISTAGGELSGIYPNPTLVNSAVVSKVLSGLNITGGTVQSTDDILTAIGKLQNQINSLIGGSIYQGVWDAATNTPTLTSSVGVKGHYYIVDVYGTTNLDGIAEWHVGDWAIFDGTEWQKVDTTDAVVSVNGLTGAVSLTTANISESGNLYFTTDRARTSLSAGVGLSYDNVNGIFSSTITQYTDALARQAISLTTTGNNGTASYDNSTGVLNIPQYTLAGLGGVPTSRTLSINGETYDLSENRSWTIAAGVTSFNTRTGAITLISGDVTDALGFTPYNSTNPSGYISGITSGMVTGALGYTPYNATNPAGYITGITSSNVTTALGYTPVTNARTLTINGTTYDLTADRSWTIAGGVTSFNTRTGAITLISSDVTTALGYTPANGANYLPLVGGTLTGALTGTFATFNGFVDINSSLTIKSSTPSGISISSYNANELRLGNTFSGTTYYQNLVFSNSSRTYTFPAATGTIALTSNIPTDNSQLTNGAGYITSAALSSYLPLSGGTMTGNLIVSNANALVKAESTNPANHAIISANWTSGVGMEMTYHPNSAVGYINNTYPITSGQEYGDIRFRSYVSGGTYNTNMIIKGYSGNVGIGTANPSVKFHVNGTSYIGTMTSFNPAVEIRGGYYGAARLQIYGLDSDANAHMGLGTDMGAGAYELSIFYSDVSGSRIAFGRHNGGNGTRYSGFTVTATLSYGGTFTAAGDVVAYGSPSDARLKTIKEKIPNALEKILKLNGYRFDWNKIDSLTKLKEDVGVIAQEVEKVLPELARTNDDGTMSVRYQGLIAVLIEAIKEQQTQIEELKRIINGFTN